MAQTRRRAVRLLALALAVCLLGGCAARDLALLPPSPTPGVTGTPAPSPAPPVLRVFFESAQPGLDALLAAYSASRAVRVEPAASREAADLCLLASAPNAADAAAYADLAQDTLLSVLVQAAGGLAAPAADGSCRALPLGFGGYGYLADEALLRALLGDGFSAAALQQASWQEWEGLVQALGVWIQDPAEQPVTLAGQTFTLPAEKPAPAQGLTGVFAVPDAEPDAFSGSVLSPALCCAGLDGPAALQGDPDALTGPLNSLWILFRLETGWMAGPDGPRRRGAQAEPASLADAAALLASGRAVFCRAGTGALDALCDPDFAARLILIPLKFSFDETDLAPGAAYSLDQLIRWPVVRAPAWLAIPAGAQPAQRAQAESFLLWLGASPEGAAALGEATGLLGFAGGAPDSPAQRAAAEALAARAFLPDPIGAFSAAQQAAASSALADTWLPQASWNPAQRPGYVQAMRQALGAG